MLIEHSGALELTLTGENLTSDTLQLYHDGTLYTPLVLTETSATYILGDNGLNKIYLNGKFYTAIQVSGVVVPEGIPTVFIASQRANSTTTEAVNQIDYMGNCINYPYKVSEELPIFNLIVGSQTYPFTELTGFEGVNAAITVNASATGTSRIVIKATVTDTTKPAYIKYQGFIVAVFNY